MRDQGVLLKKNIGASLLLQVATIISGFVIPRIILLYFGSEVNGLISSINQFLNYIQLLEGGVSGVIMAALYKPLAEHDDKRISGIINATNSFFRKIGMIYILYAVIIAFVYPLFVNTGFGYCYSFALVIVLGINLFVQYYFSLTYKLLLNADRRVYFVSLTQIIIVCINTFCVIIVAYFFRDILILKAASVVVYFIQPIMYSAYVNKHYSLDKTEKKDEKAISQRWDAFQINVAYFVHTNTDIIILTLFSSLTNVSVYSVYLMIVSALKSLVYAVSQSIVPSFGNILARKDAETTNVAFDEYELGISTITVLLFSCGITLITPFVDLYTKNINDANYHQPVFGALLCLAEMVYCFRDPYISAVYSAGHFKQVSKYAMIEAAINIVISLFLVRKFGITGVALGTLISMIYRLVCHVSYLKKNILHRPIMKFFKNGASCFIMTLLILGISQVIRPIYIDSYISWCCYAVIVLLISIIVIVVKMCLFDFESLKSFLYRFIKKDQ